MKAFVQFKDGDYFNENFYLARKGFQQMGYVVEPFNETDYKKAGIAKETPCFTTVEMFNLIQKYLKIKCDILPSYPESIIEYCFREIVETDVSHVLKAAERIDNIKYNKFFIKPIDEHRKAFTGIVVESIADVQFLKTWPPTFPLYLSRYMNFKSEYRVFIDQGRIIDARLYSGDPFLVLDKFTIETCIKKLNLAYGISAPRSYSLDFGIWGSNNTSLVEATDMVALGAYGLDSKYFGEMIVRRWDQLMRQAKNISKNI